MGFHVEQEETLDRHGLAALQESKFRAMVREVALTNSFWRRRFEKTGFDPERDSVSALPLLSRTVLEADQATHPPYGTNLTYGLDRYPRLHQTSGSTAGVPLRCLDTDASWTWWKRCWGTIYRAADLCASDRLFFPFSFGPFIGFWGAFESAAQLGNFCLPAGGMSTTARLHYLLDHKATVICCTPTYALRLAEVGDQEKLDLKGSCVRALIVAGEPGGHVPQVRARIESAWGARVFDHAGMTEVGPWGFECSEEPEGFHVMENEFIAEVVEPSSGCPVGEGEIGELVLTNLGRWGGPLIRYRTGDQVRLIRTRCACGRWFARVPGGILGRTDDMLYIRGNNVFPSTIEGVLRGVEGLAEFRVDVDQRGSLTEMSVTVEPDAEENSTVLAARVVRAIKDCFHFQPKVRVVAPGSLPRFEMKARRFIRSKTTGTPASSPDNP